MLGPGPGSPSRSDLFDRWLFAADQTMPVLGVCLGMQAIAVHYGEAIGRLRPVHGYQAEVRHHGRGLFKDLPDPFTVGRYHSLGFRELSSSDTLEVHAVSSSGLIMAIKVMGKPIYGVQFHPESVLTPEGDQLFTNFLKLSGNQPCTVGRTPRGSITSAS